MAGMWLRDIFRHIIHMNIGGNNPEIAIYRPWTICPGYTVTEGELNLMLPKGDGSPEKPFQS
jgi:hypothetical protein